MKTYTVQDYLETFGGRRSGWVGVDRDGDLIWTSDKAIEWADRSIVVDHPTLMQYQGRMAPTDTLTTYEDR